MLPPRGATGLFGTPPRLLAHGKDRLAPTSQPTKTPCIGNAVGTRTKGPMIWVGILTNWYLAQKLEEVIRSLKCCIHSSWLITTISDQIRLFVNFAAKSWKNISSGTMYRAPSVSSAQYDNLLIVVAFRVLDTAQLCKTKLTWFPIDGVRRLVLK